MADMNNDTATILDGLLFTAANKWQMDEEQIMENMNKIAFHESKYGTDRYTPIQETSEGASTEASIIPSFLGEGAIGAGTDYGEGVGRGMFQFEKGKDQGAHTAIKRLTNLLESQGAVVPDWISGLSENEYDVSELSPEQQQILFLGNLLQKPTKSGRTPASFAGIDTDEELAKYWAQHHQAGTTPGSKGEEEMISKFLKDIGYYGKV